ncbi:MULTISPECIES: NfeD family protein [unclassified Agarivorans]|uniref:NfeD family protein n=1 Tax=unclassified Agarivorans TaxID=2636026 RepID=UPI0026E1DD6B|nr:MULTISPECIES: NfeD family protein [unclassified Agarivorans]MDO6685778.1 NfeD family protein [Agarivorans sp. 3_MG-2023]MDO6716107.1 NfeD family protein [Agarivorans sp. 2_MG-2023]MDO6764273.1 NfeD family protein [Agarivorans sp. 1_MG-2023]
MAELFANHIPQILIALGIILLTVEVVIIGFATFILFFVGLSLVITGSLIWLNILPDTWNSILLANAVLSSLLAGVLWKPMRKLQNSSDDKQVSSDFDGHRFFCHQEIDKRGLSTYKHSGISWTLKSEHTIAADTEVEVVRAEVGTFWVKTVD